MQTHSSRKKRLFNNLNFLSSEEIKTVNIKDMEVIKIKKIFDLITVSKSSKTTKLFKVVFDIKVPFLL
jgi:hypothetical protein